MGRVGTRRLIRDNKELLLRARCPSRASLACVMWPQRKFGGIIVRIYELNNILAAQALSSFQRFSDESLGMMGNYVGLDFIGTNPTEIAEWTLALVHVFVPHVSLAEIF